MERIDKRKARLEKLLKEIEKEPSEDCLTENEIKFLEEIEYLKAGNFKLYVTYYNRWKQIKPDEIN